MDAFFNSTEFYVIASVAAAAVIGYCVKPPQYGPSLEKLIEGTLLYIQPDERPEAATSARITLECGDDGSVTLLRQGIEDLTDTGACNIAAKLIGHSLIIEERLVYPVPSSRKGNCHSSPIAAIDENPTATAVNAALFRLDFLKPGRYNIRYNSSATGLFTAFYFTLRPGNRIDSQLSQ